MADNTTLNSGTGGDTIATDAVTYSGDAAKIQVVRVVHVSGAEGSKSVSEIVGTAGTPSTGVVTVQGVSSGTALAVSDGGGNLSVDDGGGSLTVDGSVTVTQATAANLNATVVGTGTFAVQATLQASTNTTEVVGDAAHDAAAAGNPVLVGGYASAAAPTDVSADGNVARIWTTVKGAVNVADAGGSLSVDDNGGNLSVDDGGGSLTVDNAGLTDLDNAGATIGTTPLIRVAVFDASDNQITSFGGAGGSGTEYTEDAAAAANPVGGVQILVRKDSPASEVSADGDNIAQRGSAYGAAYVTLLDGSGAVVSGATQYTEDAAAAADPIGNAVILVRKDTPAAIASADGDNIAARGTNYGAQYVTLLDTSGNAVSVGGGTQYDEDTAHVSGDKLTMAGVVRADTAASLAGTDGDRTALIVDASGRLHVNGSGVTQPVSMATNTPVGTVAHDSADSGAPLKIGAKAETALSGVTLVADGDRSDLYCGADGVLYTRDVCLEDVVQERATNTDGASTAFASGLAAPGAGIRLWIKSVTICNSSATFCTVDLRDGAAGSVLWTFPVPATGGVTHVFDPPLKLTANTALAYDASAATTTLTISANGFKSKV